MAKIIRDIKLKTEYYQDYRCGGYTNKEVEAYYCGNCKKEVESRYVEFCSHCGSPLKGIQDEIEKRRKKEVKPYKMAYDNISNLRDTFDKESIEYAYLSKTLEEIKNRINSINRNFIK